jgi:hypothetical protein
MATGTTTRTFAYFCEITVTWRARRYIVLGGWIGWLIPWLMPWWPFILLPGE